MSNPFSLRSAAIGAPLGIRHNGETITLTFADATTKRVVAIVDISDPEQVLDGPVEVNGKISIKTADVARFVTPNGVAMSATIRDQEWHLYGQAPDQFGMTTINIRRKFDESIHSNIYDISDRQATWNG